MFAVKGVAAGKVLALVEGVVVKEVAVVKEAGKQEVVAEGWRW